MQPRTEEHNSDSPDSGNYEVASPHIRLDVHISIFYYTNVESDYLFLILQRMGNILRLHYDHA